MLPTAVGHKQATRWAWRYVLLAHLTLVEFVFLEKLPEAEESAEEVQRRTDRRNRMLGIKSALPSLPPSHTRRGRALVCRPA